MTNATVLAVLDYYERILARDHRTSPSLLHVQRTMIPTMRLMIATLPLTDESPGKVFRWLGFIQGVLWCRGLFEIDEFKQHNQGQNL